MVGDYIASGPLAYHLVRNGNGLIFGLVRQHRLAIPVKQELPRSLHGE